MKNSNLARILAFATPIIEQLRQRDEIERLRQREREKLAEDRHSKLMSSAWNAATFIGARLDNLGSLLGVRLDSAVVTPREYAADTMRATTRVVDIFDRAERHQREHRDEVTVTLTSAEVFELLGERIKGADKHISAIQEKIDKADPSDTLRLRRHLSEECDLRSDYVFMRDHLSQGKVFEMNRHATHFLAPQDYENEAWFDANLTDEEG